MVSNHNKGLALSYAFRHRFCKWVQVRQYLMEGQRQDLTRQAVINITEDAVWNLMSACSNTGLPQPVMYLPSGTRGEGGFSSLWMSCLTCRARAFVVSFVGPLQDFSLACCCCMPGLPSIRLQHASLEQKQQEAAGTGDRTPEAVHAHIGCTIPHWPANSLLGMCVVPVCSLRPWHCSVFCPHQLKESMIILSL